jgi:putative flippase GtrA
MNPEKLKLIIFSLIGVFNTLFDITLYIILLHITHSIILANVVSTSAALVGSYFLNTRLTFKTKMWTAKTFISFIVVTVFGLWVLQTLAIYLFAHLLKTIPEHIWQLLGPTESFARSVIPKLLATVITFAWNYLWYNRVIFKDSSKETAALIALDEL